MKIDEAIRSVINQYAGFAGRAGRSEFWYWILFTFVVSTILSILSGYVAILSIVGMIFSLATIVPTIAVGARRMHDIGKSGWWQIAPLYNIYLAIQPSDGPNSYGTGPAGAPAVA